MSLKLVCGDGDLVWAEGSYLEPQEGTLLAADVAAVVVVAVEHCRPSIPSFDFLIILWINKTVSLLLCSSQMFFFFIVLPFLLQVDLFTPSVFGTFEFGRNLALYH